MTSAHGHNGRQHEGGGGAGVSAADNDDVAALIGFPWVLTDLLVQIKRRVRGYSRGGGGGAGGGGGDSGSNER